MTRFKRTVSDDGFIVVETTYLEADEFAAAIAVLETAPVVKPVRGYIGWRNGYWYQLEDHEVPDE